MKYVVSPEVLGTITVVGAGIIAALINRTIKLHRNRVLVKAQQDSVFPPRGNYWRKEQAEYQPPDKLFT